MIGMKARVSSARVSQSTRGNSIQHAFLPGPLSCNTASSSSARQRPNVTVSNHQHVQPRQCTVIAMCTSSPSSPAVAVEAESPAVEDLLEITQENYYSYLADAPKTELVVVDFYTDWCGPCKLIYPELVKINSNMEGVTVVKLNCNKKNKELGVKLGIKVAPTFYIYRDSVKLAEMTGAKVERLLTLLQDQQVPAAVVAAPTSA